jgi:heptaprenyl diphosphate synthase
MAMLLALIVVLSIIEGSLPPIPMLPPGVKLGLANVVTMFALFYIGKREALGLNVLKSGFVLITRGFTAGVLSLCGGLLSVIVLIILTALFKDRLSYIILSIFGAIFHNIGQLAAIIVILGTLNTAYYLPVLIIAGIIMGAVTGILLKTLLPALKGISPRKDNH